jgi:hypothetical protein
MARFRGLILRLAMTAVLLLAATACASKGSAGSGLPDMVDVQAMIHAWTTGTCPAPGSRWGGFDRGVPVPSEQPSPGARVETVAPQVDRFVLCRYTAVGEQRLTDSTVVAAPGAVARLVGDLDSVTASASSCRGTRIVYVLAGFGANVLGMDVSEGGCTALTSTAGVADYGRTALGHDLDAAFPTS